MEFTIKISTADVVFIGNLLAEQPYKQAAPIINRIQAQLDEQQKAAIAAATSGAAETATDAAHEAELDAVHCERVHAEALPAEAA